MNERVVGVVGVGDVGVVGDAAEIFWLVHAAEGVVVLTRLQLLIRRTTGLVGLFSSMTSSWALRKLRSR